MTDVFIPLQVTVIGNGIFDNRDHGLFVKNQATVEENDIVGNQRSALQLERNSNVTVSLFIARVLYGQKHIQLSSASLFFTCLFEQVRVWSVSCYIFVTSRGHQQK